MKLDPEKVVSISTNSIKHIFKLNFNKDNIDKIKDSITKIGYEPFIVRRKGDKYQLCSNPEIFEALKLLEYDAVQVIIRDITEQKGREITLASVFSTIELSSKETEILVWNTYKSGDYKSQAEFAKIIGKSDVWVINNYYGKEQREKLFGTDVTSDYISTETLRLIRPLPDDEQKLFCDRIQDEKIGAGEARNCYKFLSDESLSKEIKNGVLKGEINWRNAKRIYETRQPGIKAMQDAINEYHKKEVIQNIIDNDQPKFSSEPFRLLCEFTNSINVDSILNIKDKTKIEQVKRYLRISGTQIFQLLYELKIIDKEQYNQICNISKITPEIIKELKEDGRCYFFPDSWLTDSEKKIKERTNKLLNGTNEPLLR